jgi:peptide/nickel transport system permease protein
LGHTLLSVASLGFLGLGLQPPSPEWGTMIMEAKPYVMRAPWMAVFPGFFIFNFIFIFTLAGRRLEKMFQTEKSQFQ